MSASQLSLEGQTFTPMKKCSTCGEVKAREEFSKNRSKKDGVHSQCKQCDRAYRATHKEEKAAYRATHKEEIAAYRAAYDATHKEEKAKSNAAYDATHKEEKAKYVAAHRAANPRRIWSTTTIKTHRYSGHVIIITVDELIEMAKKVTNCPICDCEINWLVKGRSGPNSPSLDRKYNGNRISKETCWILCYRCNTMKRDLPMPEYVAHCRKVVERFGSKASS